MYRCVFHITIARINFSKQVSHISKINFSKVFAAGYRAISRLIIEFPIEQKGFAKDLRFSLAHTARKLFPKKNIAELSHMTGLLRGQIDDALDSDCPVRVMDKESIILSDLWRYRDKDNLIPINGKEDNSFYTITMKHLKGKHSVSSVMETLIKSGSIKRADDKLVILTNSFTQNKEEEMVINITGLVLDRFIDTIIHNVNSEGTEKRYQQTFKSSKIPPSSRGALHAVLHAKCKIAMLDFRKTIEQFEVEVPNGHYPECGISMFVFDMKQNKKGEKNE